MKGKILIILFFVVIVLLAALAMGAGFARKPFQTPGKSDYSWLRGATRNPIRLSDIQTGCRFQRGEFQLRQGERCVVCVRGRGWMPRSAALHAGPTSPGVGFEPIAAQGAIDTSAFGGECTRSAKARRAVQSVQPACLGAGSIAGKRCQKDRPADLRVDRKGGLFVIRCESRSGCRVRLAPK